MMFETPRIGEPYFLRNLVIYPIIGTGNGNYLSIEEARDRGVLFLNDTGVVNEAELDFEGGGRLFVLDGEEIIGALQNRVFNTSMVASKPVSARVPVTCVEQNRWSGNREFHHSGVVAYPSLRSILASSVTQSLKLNKSFKSDQSAIWKSVRSTLKSFRVKSVTSSMHDAYSTLRDDIDRFVEDAEFSEDTKGFIVVAGKKILGMDIFVGPGLFKKMSKKLLRGYALEALESMMYGPGDFKEAEIQNFIDYVFSRDYMVADGVIEGQELRFADKKAVAHALKLNNEVIHFAAFPVY